mmetsp:Transcript_13161/g.30766  ORF Transcript_13161/g.30766 Transcript_13161/m.30766 type:complete len:447 (+) Transcript_13161:90-1430(+)
MGLSHAAASSHEVHESSKDDSTQHTRGMTSPQISTGMQFDDGIAAAAQDIGCCSPSCPSRVADEDVLHVLDALTTCLRAGIFCIPDVAQLIEILRNRQEQELEIKEASVKDVSDRFCTTVGAAPKPVQILPDLVQVHMTLTNLASVMPFLPRPEDCIAKDCRDKQKCLLYLVPAWDWRWRPPKAAQFWKAAHAVARDHNGDDWIAPHMTLHSRSSTVRGLATKFCQMLSDISASKWRELLHRLRDPSNWALDEDRTPSRKPSDEHHYVLHKAHIDLPESFRQWLFENQDEAMRPRKQDVALHKKNCGGKIEDGRVPIDAPFHVSLYSFRAAHDLPQDAFGNKDFGMSTGSLLSAAGISSAANATDATLASSPMNSSALPERSLKRKGTDYGLEVPPEQALRGDLAAADWMWVFGVPGRTSENSLVPSVFAAVPLEALAGGTLPRRP